MMNYLSSLFGGGNAAGGMRMPQMGQGMDLYGGQTRSNLGLSMPSNPYANPDTGTGMMPPSSFGKMPDGFSMGNLNMAKTLLDAGKEKVAPMPQVQLPMGSNQNYDQLLKMYGIRGLLG
jgi:hypothetical protein